MSAEILQADGSPILRRRPVENRRAYSHAPGAYHDEALAWSSS